MTPICSFDYYEGTLTGVTDPTTPLQTLGGVGLATQGGRRQNYPASYVWDLPNGGHVEIWHGGGLEVHISLSSGACDELVGAVRRLWAHRVNRADVAMDFDYPGAFEVLYRGLEGAAVSHKPRPVNSYTFGDWLRAEKGRTLYLGSGKSRLLMRCYEKGHEQAAAHPDRSFSLDWVRVEWQARPHSRQKESFSLMTPHEVASATHFGGEALALLAGASQAALPLQRVAATDPLYWMLRQYRAALEALAIAEPDLTVVELAARAQQLVPA